MTHILQHSNESITQEWYTPEYAIKAVRDTMGGIDLDPASCHMANEIVQATRYFTHEDNGLGKNWHGRVFMNPPYGKTGIRSNQGIWLDKLIREYETGLVTQAVSLFNVSVGSTWFNKLYDYPMAWFHSRIKFYNEEGVATAPRYGNVAVYMGNHPHNFARAFEDFATTTWRMV